MALISAALKIILTQLMLFKIIVVFWLELYAKIIFYKFDTILNSFLVIGLGICDLKLIDFFLFLFWSVVINVA